MTLTDSELAGMRSVSSEYLAGTAIIQNQSFVSDGGGGGTASWVSAGTVDCRVAPVAGSGEGESVKGGRLHPDTEYVFTFPNGTVLSDDSRILYGSQVFTVTSLRSPRTWEITRRVECKEVA